MFVNIFKFFRQPFLHDMCKNFSAAWWVYFQVGKMLWYNILFLIFQKDRVLTQRNEGEYSHLQERRYPARPFTDF